MKDDAVSLSATIVQNYPPETIFLPGGKQQKNMESMAEYLGGNSSFEGGKKGVINGVNHLKTKQTDFFGNLPKSVRCRVCW